CAGSFGSHTAALSAPYDDAPGTSGHLWHGVDEMADHIAACTRAGVQAGFHAIGDAALRSVLEAMGKAAGQVGLDALVAARHRIEHAEMPPADGVPGATGPREATGAFVVGGPGGTTGGAEATGAFVVGGPGGTTGGAEATGAFAVGGPGGVGGLGGVTGLGGNTGLGGSAG